MVTGAFCVSLEAKLAAAEFEILCPFPAQIALAVALHVSE